LITPERRSRNSTLAPEGAAHCNEAILVKPNVS
jgi:hypothetical protein